MLPLNHHKKTGDHFQPLSWVQKPYPRVLNNVFFWGYGVPTRIFFTPWPMLVNGFKPTYLKHMNSSNWKSFPSVSGWTCENKNYFKPPPTVAIYNWFSGVSPRLVPQSHTPSKKKCRANGLKRRSVNRCFTWTSRRGERLWTNGCHFLSASLQNTMLFRLSCWKTW